MKATTKLLWCLMLIFAMCGLVIGQGNDRNAKDIRKLSQHFTDLKDISPWTFEPQDNIKQVDTTEHPGYLTIWPGDRGRDIKGVLKEPIRMDEYSYPWEFHMGFAKHSYAYTGPSEKQVNYAFGLNIAVTFSDPSTWPKDRSQPPPDTHTLQLFIVHIGYYGQKRPALPQIKNSELNYHDPSPEVFLVYGRGDLAQNVVGDWKIPYLWNGYQPPSLGQLGATADWAWSEDAGPASKFNRFRVRVASPTMLEVGVGYGMGVHHGWRMRSVDVSRFGKITGIWEMGPIVSLDRWIPDQVAPQLGLFAAPPIEAPEPAQDYYLDYALFYGNGPKNLDHLSEDFDVPGPFEDEKWFIEGTDAVYDAYSNPGYLTLTMMGINGGCALCPIVAGDYNKDFGFLDFREFKPPMEFETAFIGPDDARPWNFWFSLYFYDKDGKQRLWYPGVQNIPGKGHRFMDFYGMDYSPEVTPSPDINVKFAKEPTESILGRRPVYLLVQILDASHVRVGLKANKNDPWQLSEIFDTTSTFGEMTKVTLPCLVSYQRVKDKTTQGVGNYPSYQRYLIDYVHFRYGLSTPR